MSDGTATVIIIAFSLAIGIFVGAATPTVYGFAMFFLCIGLGTLIYSLIKMAARWKP